MKRTVFLIILALFSLSGCTTPSDGSSSLVTPVELGTPTIVIIAPEETQVPATETPTAEPVEISAQEAIGISTPIAGTSITSPLTISGEADPTFEQNLLIRLVGLDNTILASTPVTIQAEAGTRGKYQTQLTFTAGENKNALVQIYSTSARDGSLEHLNSVVVNLEPQEKQPEDFNTGDEIIQITSLKIIQNAGKLELQAEGLATGIGSKALSYKLCADTGRTGMDDFVCGNTGNVMSAGLIDVSGQEDATTGTWKIAAPLVNGQWTVGSLVVYSLSTANGEVAHAASQTIKNGP